MALPTTRDEMNQVITEQIRVAFPDQQISDINKLAQFFPGYNAFTAELLLSRPSWRRSGPS
jgi:hypothetical protein